MYNIVPKVAINGQILADCCPFIYYIDFHMI